MIDEDSVYYRAFLADKVKERNKEIQFEVLYGITTMDETKRIETPPLTDEEEYYMVDEFERMQYKMMEVKCELFIINDIIATFFEKRLRQ